MICNMHGFSSTKFPDSVGLDIKNKKQRERERERERVSESYCIIFLEFPLVSSSDSCKLHMIGVVFHHGTLTHVNTGHI